MGAPIVGSAAWPLTGARRATALTVLTVAEAARLADDPHAERFLAGRMLLRELVERATGRELASITVAAACPDCGREHGRPRVDGAFVSLSHAGSVVVGAVDAEHPIGVDVEPREASAERLAAIHEVSGGVGLAYWTAVEAVLKADGRGLRVDPSRVRIDGGTAELDGVAYRLTALELPGLIGTLAVASSD